MYASLENHLLNFGHYIFSFIIVFVVFPKILFRNSYKSQFDNLVSGYMKMVLFIIVLGYLLVLLKIFELIAILIALSFRVLKRYVMDRKAILTDEITVTINVFIYDCIDGVINPEKSVRQWISHRIKAISESVKGCFGGIYSTLQTILLTGTMVYSAYLRLYDAYYHAAPAMSDAYVTLAWMKYICERVLFHDGIYPQGFHIYLAVLQKFSAVNPLYVLKYSGPLNGVLITLGIYFFVSRFIERKMPGIIAAFIYGVLGQMICPDWARQASTNSQEFGFVFILPTIYFTFRYMRDSKKEDLINAACGMCITGLVHIIAYGFTGVGVIVIILSSFLSSFELNIKKLFHLFFAGAGSIIISLLPVLIGVLLGKGFHGASEEFLFQQNSHLGFPHLRLNDYAALCFIGLMLIGVLVSIVKKAGKLYRISVFLLCMSAFLIYYAGGAVTGSLVISVRSPELWALMIPVCIGAGINELLGGTEKVKVLKYLSIALCAAAIIISIVYIKPKPIIPYKMEYDSSVEQYLRIRKMIPHGEWMIVSQEEGYAMVLGSGYHLMIGDFLKWYNPEDRHLARNNNGVYEVLSTPDIFIYHQKKLYTVGMDEMKAIYERRRIEEKEISEWVRKYSENHSNISVFYEDDNLLIYRIHQG